MLIRKRIKYSQLHKGNKDYCVQDKSKDSKAHPLSVQNIGGVFVVLLCGLALAIMVSKDNPPWRKRPR